MRLIEIAWIFCNCALWNTTAFTADETLRAKELIQKILTDDKEDKSFAIFVQRVILYRTYLINQPGRYVPLPSVWLDPDNKLGFSSTAAWYDRISVIREAVPGYKQGIKAFATSLVELAESPSAAHYNYWKNYFIDHKQPSLLSLFQSVVSSIVYL
jgi:hypothetical protein